MPFTGEEGRGGQEERRRSEEEERSVQGATRTSRMLHAGQELLYPRAKYYSTPTTPKKLSGIAKVT